MTQMIFSRWGGRVELMVMNAAKIRVLGVDPGTQNTGYGLIDISRAGRSQKLSAQCMGAITSPSKELSLRLLDIGRDFGALLDKLQPQVVVIEKIFLAKNVDSAFKLGHARGILMYEALQRKMLVVEIATRIVKKVVTGTGAADKLQVQKSLSFLLKLSPQAFDSVPLDASDALALAYTFAEQDQMRWLLRESEIAR